MQQPLFITGSFALAFTVAIIGAQPQPSTLTDSALREMTPAAIAKAKKGDPDAAVKELDRAVKERFGEVDARPISLYYSEDLQVFATGPYYDYRSSIHDKIRKMEAIDEVHYEDKVTLTVYPKTINSPDISKVVVQRNGQTVEPLSSDLESKELKTRMGAAFSVHVGQITYPLSAFAPGGQITITMIPESGRNIDRKLSDSELKRLR